MSQTRTFLIFAWLMVAALLWMEWNKEQMPVPALAPVATVPGGSVPQGGVPAAAGVPGAAAIPGAAVPAATIPGASVPGAAGPGAPVPPATAAGPASTPTMSETTQPPAGDRVVVSTDVLRLTLDGGNVFDAELLRYPQNKADSSTPVKLLNDDPASYYVAQSGWVGQDGGQAPTHLGGFVPEHPERTYTLAAGQKELSVPFVWRNADGVTIRRTYTFTPGSYTMSVHDEVDNAGTKPWQGFIYRQLARTPPIAKSGLTNPEAYSFAGATWFGAEHGYERRKYSDFVDDGPLDRTIKGGWAAMLQHHFFTAWIPQADQQARFDVGQTGTVDRINISGPSFTVAPGQQASSTARLWVGPKLVDQIQAQAVPGLDRAVDYSRFSMFALLGQGLFWVLSKLHGFIGNWGWSIIAMVVLLKIVLFPLSAAQYKSAARMRRFQPRIAQLKERYGDDKQKFQAAMMELYKKEKINPIGGCLPVLPQMIIFMALYWVLMESVELRQAPWMGWIQDLTARDPYFILPVVNMVIMYTTQKLQPAIGMDPMQQKMMQFMPLAFGVLLAFLPAGLVLYQVANGGLGLLQQWLATKKYADPPPGALVDSKA